jgi:hypothetical protein
MDPDFLERKRRYKQQILDAMNEKPQQFIRATRAPLPRRRATAEPPHRAATGAELQWHAVANLWPVADENHTLVRLTPEDQDAYKDDPRFQNFDEFGRRYATLGAGPTSLSGVVAGGADLASFANQENDVAPHATGIPIKPLAGMSADDYIDYLLRLDRAYSDDLVYRIYPTGAYTGAGRAGAVHFGPTYNSNGYVSGLLTASGVRPPELPVTAPGYDRRVPANAFGK